MTTFTGPEDIYKELVDDSDENWLYGLVAFAVIEEQRIEWMKHHEKHQGSLPSADQIKEWYAQQPESTLLRAKGTAENALQAYSSDAIDTALEDHRQEIQESIIVDEIKDLKRFWPQFGISLSGGFVGAILFAALIIVVAFFVLNDTSPVSIGENIDIPTVEQNDG